MNPTWKKARIATAVYLAPLLVAGQLFWLDLARTKQGDREAGI